METHQEIEYKMLLTSTQYNLLCQSLPIDESITQVNTYFEAASNPKKAIRIRQIQNQYEFCIKVNQEKGKLEYNQLVPNDSLASLELPEVQAIFRTVNLQGPFTRLGSLSTIRQNVHDTYGILSLDANTYLGYTDYEVEYELYEDDERGYNRFVSLLASLGITYQENTISKIQRFKMKLG